MVTLEWPTEGIKTKTKIAQNPATFIIPPPSYTGLFYVLGRREKTGTTGFHLLDMYVL